MTWPAKPRTCSRCHPAGYGARGPSVELVPVSCAAIDLKGSGSSGRSEGIEQGGKGREKPGRSCGQQQRIWSEAQREGPARGKEGAAALAALDGESGNSR